MDFFYIPNISALLGKKGVHILLGRNGFYQKSKAMARVANPPGLAGRPRIRPSFAKISKLNKGDF